MTPTFNYMHLGLRPHPIPVPEGKRASPKPFFFSLTSPNRAQTSIRYSQSSRHPILHLKSSSRRMSKQMTIVTNLSSIHNFKNVETIPPANTNAGFRLIEITTEEDDDIKYVSGNVFVPSKIEYEHYEDNEESLRQQMNIGWYEVDDVGEETTMAASGETKVTTGYLSKWEDMLVGMLDKFGCGGSVVNDENCSNNDAVGFSSESQWRLVLQEKN